MLPVELSPIIIGIFGVTAGILMVASFHCIRVCLDHGDQGRRRRRRAPAPAPAHPLTGRGQTASGHHNYQQDASTSSAAINESGSFSTIRLLVVDTNFSTECQEETCSVCLSEFNEGDEVRVLPGCAHVFHVLCIDKWLLCHANCPLCRANALSSLPDTPVNDSQSNTGGNGPTPTPGIQHS